MAEEAAADFENAPPLVRDLKDGVLFLTLSRPKSRNSLSEAMMAALTAAVREAGEDSATRVIVLRAEGPAFCAGHDLKELTARRADGDRGHAYFAEIMSRCSTLMQAIVTCPKPVIAQVNGIATAAGCQLVASCDLAIAAEGTRFATPGVNIGLFCSTPMVALSRNVAPKHALEMLLTGDMINADKAAEFGLVNRVVPADRLAAETEALARQIASKSAHTVAIGKRAFYEQREMPLADAYTYASEIMVRNMLARDAEEGISAFLEKRDPTWTDS